MILGLRAAGRINLSINGEKKTYGMARLGTGPGTGGKGISEMGNFSAESQVAIVTAQNAPLSLESSKIKWK